MAIPAIFHEGNRAEYLAMYFLSKVGLVVPVPRQSDLFGVDFIVHLIKCERGAIIPTGKAFAVQVKSNHDPILYKGERLSCLWAMGLPFFLGIVSRDGLAFTIYQTLARLNYMWKIGPQQEFRLCPGGDKAALYAQNWPESRVYTGSEAITLRAGDLDEGAIEDEVRKRFYESIRVWVEFEEISLSWRKQNIPLVELPEDYTPGIPPDLTRRLRASYANPRTLPFICAAVQFPMFSLDHYLEDLFDRCGKEPLPIHPDLLDVAKHLAEAVRAVKIDAERIVKMFQVSST